MDLTRKELWKRHKFHNRILIFLMDRNWDSENKYSLYVSSSNPHHIILVLTLLALWFRQLSSFSWPALSSAGIWLLSLLYYIPRKWLSTQQLKKFVHS
jgi:hypothetical protein